MKFFHEPDSDWDCYVECKPCWLDGPSVCCDFVCKW